MTSKRLYFLLLAVIAAGFVALIGGAYVGNSVMTKHAQELSMAKAKSLALEQEQQSLVRAKKQVEQYAELEKITRTVVPEDKNQAEAVGELVKIAQQNGVALSSITFPASTLGAARANASASASSSAKAGTTTTAGLGSGNAASERAAKTSQLQPIKNIPGVYLLVINVQSDTKAPVPYSKFISFLDDLEHNRRTAQVSNIALNPSIDNRNNISFTLSINEYIKP